MMKLKKRFNLFFTDAYYILHYDDIGILSGSEGYAIIDAKTDEIVDVEVIRRS